MKKLVALLLVFAAIGAAAYFGYHYLAGGVTIDIPASAIQRQLDATFPIQKNYVLTSITLSHPKVTLKEGSDRIDFSLDVAVSALGQQKASGAADVSGSIEYVPAKGEFFLKNARVEHVSVSGLAEQHVKEIKELLTVAGQQALDRYPIYTLQNDRRVESIAKLFLKSVTVSGGELKLTMGLRAQ